MRYRVLTVSREYGSGGAEIAHLVARDLGWRLIDREMMDEISRRGRVSASEAAAFDERVDPLIHRITRSIWGLGVDGVSAIAPVDMFDAERAADLTRQVIEETYKAGSCVIVGRGSQFVLQNRPDVYHAFIYARWEDRVARIKERIKPGQDPEAVIRSMDAERMEYLRLHFKQNRGNPHLYDIMIDSKNQPEKVAGLIVSAMSWDVE
jgi:cytidylate kinase